MRYDVICEVDADEIWLFWRLDIGACHCQPCLALVGRSTGSARRHVPIHTRTIQHNISSMNQATLVCLPSCCLPEPGRH